MAGTLHCFRLKVSRLTVEPVTVLFGDDLFLRRLARQAVLDRLLDDPDAPYTTFSGNSAQWRDVRDELSTVSLFGGATRLAVVEDADPFVKTNRARLEQYVENHSANSVLLLEVEAWPRNTRLFKLVESHGLQIECRAPEKGAGSRKVLDRAAVEGWLVERASAVHRFKLGKPAAALLLELVGAEFGLLDQELAKLALFAAEDAAVDPQQVQRVVGGWRSLTIWEIVDAALEGRSADAVLQIDHLLQSGEHPLGLFGQIAWALRRYAAATRIFEQAERRGQRMRLSEALVQAGFPHWNPKALSRAEAQLKRLGRHRAAEIYRWLLEADLALKGSHSSPQRARLALEKLFWRCSVT